MPDASTISALKEFINVVGTPTALLLGLFWVLKPLASRLVQAHEGFLQKVSDTNDQMAITQQQNAVTMQTLANGHVVTHKHMEQAQSKLDQLLQRKA